MECQRKYLLVRTKTNKKDYRFNENLIINIREINNEKISCAFNN